MNWLVDYTREAERTDTLSTTPNHRSLLIAGLAGETGSILAELKKAARERDAYPAYRDRLIEEIGDALWYLTRLRALAGAPSTPSPDVLLARFEERDSLVAGLALSAAVGRLSAAAADQSNTALEEPLYQVAIGLALVAAAVKIPLDLAATHNIEKIRSRWPSERTYYPLFDDAEPVEDQLPRLLDIEFRELDRGGKHVTLLRCNGLNFGDRVTDNIEDPDFYRYHDIFHFAHAVYLGWSPVVRALLRAKRKSKPAKDEQQDGARAVILEEAVTAIVFSRAKLLNYFDGLERVDYDLLKTVHTFIQGFEVAKVPLWQWERAIIEGYRIFRFLRTNRHGHVTLDLNNRVLHYSL